MDYRVEPAAERSRETVIPVSRVTDAVGLSLRRAFAPPPGGDVDFASLLHRLDRLH